MSSNLVDWLFRRPSLDDLAETSASLAASPRPYTGRSLLARDESRRELLRVLRTYAAQRVRENMNAEAVGVPHEYIPLAIAADILRHDPLSSLDEDESGVDSSPELSWEAEHGPDTASSPYRSPAPMPPKREKPIAPVTSRMSRVTHFVMVYVVSFVVCLAVAQLFVWCVGR